MLRKKKAHSRFAGVKMMSDVSPVLKVTSLPHRRAEIQTASLRIASFAGLGGKYNGCFF